MRRSITSVHVRDRFSMFARRPSFWVRAAPLVVEDEHRKGLCRHRRSHEPMLGGSCGGGFEASLELRQSKQMKGRPGRPSGPRGAGPGFASWHRRHCAITILPVVIHALQRSVWRSLILSAHDRSASPALGHVSRRGRLWMLRAFHSCRRIKSWMRRTGVFRRARQTLERRPANGLFRRHEDGYVPRPPTDEESRDLDLDLDPRRQHISRHSRGRALPETLV